MSETRVSEVLVEDQQAVLDEVVKMFVDATPPVGAPIEDWRAGFENMAASFEIPADAVIEPVEADGVPGLKVSAPGAADDRVIIHFHSGGYVQGSSTSYRNFAYRLSAVTQAPVIVPDYRLAPENPFPAPVEDATTVYRWALAQWDASRIVISGDSAGGGLAMATLLALRDSGAPRPAAGVTISALLDLAGEGQSATTNAESDPLIDRAMVVDMGKVYIGDIDPHTEPYCSPLWGQHNDLPPLLLLASNSEVLRDDSVRFAESVRAAGGSAELSLPEGMVHIWTLFPKLEQAEASLKEIGDFVRSHLG
ncbi:alpha/beta hydrolase [Georgenia thermotolerans]|uniref:Alpha/beta hydrolase fold domain-containing protein n=1 Tax=Georgenia thermotolerans TaxID=527326 RepID=A0A7J5UUB6_9MICO|nr:alpha/beta hydrolase [Georgenia thermotolerans]KAE8765881.1 alpha/beta hydrolase fold domain-containing protein [Georgenia thermotolerans]